MDKQGPKIGLLGGSFNPAHSGHLEISLSALERLELDYIWWLVSPGNPLKSDTDMASFEARFKSAAKMATDERIIITDIEKKLETRYTIDTLLELTKGYPENQFIWLMGADNLAQFDQWKDWKKIAETVPFAIFNRPSYSKLSKTSVAAEYLNDYRIDERYAHTLYERKPPAWVYCSDNNNPMSSTELRKKLQ